jgi:O-6-methylguanine DNA methyltransferase
MQRIYYTSFLTPVGRIYLATTEKGICLLSWGYRSRKGFVREVRNQKPAPAGSKQESEVRIIVKDDSHLTGIKSDIKRYFSGKPVSFKKYALDLKGTNFQKKVWYVLSTIPYGKVLTYKQVSERIGMPEAARAVGSACGANDLPIIIPCHRVIASNGGLGGFSGGLKIKKHLLKLEGIKLKKSKNLKKP